MNKKIDEAFQEAQERMKNSLKKVKEDMKRTLLEQPSDAKVKIMEALSTSFHAAYQLETLKSLIFQNYFEGKIDLTSINEKIDAHLQGEEQKKAQNNLKDSMKEAKKISYLSQEFFKKTTEKVVSVIPDF